jgi:DNA-directed RNA polymerase subunit beta'
LPNKIGYLLGVSSKKLESIVYYERFVVIQAGIRAEKGLNYGDLITEEEYLDILEALPKENQYLADDDPNKFIAKMGAEAVHDMLQRIDLDQLSFDLRNAAATETSQQRKAMH